MNNEKTHPLLDGLFCGDSWTRTNGPFAQWSPETLGAGFILPFALTNSGRLPSALPTGETLPSFAPSMCTHLLRSLIRIQIATT